MDTMFVKPARPDLKVAIPNRRREFLPAEGDEVPRSTYWLRRLIDQDVVETAPPKPEKPKPTPKKEA